MLGGESSNYFFPTPLDENRYQFDLNSPYELKMLGTDFNANASQWLYQQCGISQEPDNSDMTSLSLNIYGSDCLDCSLKLGLLNHDLYPDPASVSTSLSLCLPEDQHNRRAGTSSTSLALFSVYNDLRAEISRQEDEINEFIRKKEAEMCREFLKISHRQVTGLANSIERLCEQKIIEKDFELQMMYAKTQDLTEKVNQVAAEARHWESQAWESEAKVGTLQAELGRAREWGKNDAESCVQGGEVGDMTTRCRMCKREEARILHLPCCHLSVCAGCDQTAEACPICLSPKTQSVPVIFP